MAHLLHIDSSPRFEASHSRMLTNEFVTAWRVAHPDATVTYRDVGHNPPPHVDEAWIIAQWTEPDQMTPAIAEGLTVSNELIDELIAADYYVFGVPMHTLTVPSQFKAYMEQIFRIGRTITLNPDGSTQGTLENKKLIVITTRGWGGYKPGGPLASHDYLVPFMRDLFAFVGITDITFVNVEGVDMPDLLQQSLAEARAELQALVRTW